jgi:large subunit ribosomal protein L3
MIGFAKKIGMTRLFEDNKNVPVTVLLLEDNRIVQRKSSERDGYKSIQIGAFTKKTKKSAKARIGHVKKHLEREVDFYCLGEFRGCEIPEEKKVIKIDDFEEGSSYNISGITIGRGFTGVVKRYGFAGQPSSHGHDHKRAPGSIGGRWPQRVLPGKKMAGRHGGSKVTVRNVKIVAVDKENGLLFVKGSVPGANNNYIRLEKIT